MGEILKNQEKQLANHDKRLADMEAKPAHRWEIVINAALQWLVVGVLAAVVYFR